VKNHIPRSVGAVDNLDVRNVAIITLPQLLSFHRSIVNRRIPPSPLNLTTTLCKAFGPSVPAASSSMPFSPPLYDCSVFSSLPNNAGFVFQVPRHKKAPLPNATETTSELHYSKWILRFDERPSVRKAAPFCPTTTSSPLARLPKIRYHAQGGFGKEGRFRESVRSPHDFRDFKLIRQLSDIFHCYEGLPDLRPRLSSRDQERDEERPTNDDQYFFR
jgi:hypothetical protein